MAEYIRRCQACGGEFTISASQYDSGVEAGTTLPSVCAPCIAGPVRLSWWAVHKGQQFATHVLSATIRLRDQEAANLRAASLVGCA
jgi:hypothetical protein